MVAEQMRQIVRDSQLPAWKARAIIKIIDFLVEPCERGVFPSVIADRAMALADWLNREQDRAERDYFGGER